MAAIFISHSSRDNEAAGQIKSWLDAGRLRAGLPRFRQGNGSGRRPRMGTAALREAIDRCHAVLLLVTPAWLASKWCFVEFTQARALGKVIFPIVLTADDRNLLGPPLSTIQAEQWNDAGRGSPRPSPQGRGRRDCPGVSLGPVARALAGHHVVRGRGCGGVLRARPGDPRNLRTVGGAACAGWRAAAAHRRRIGQRQVVGPQGGRVALSREGSTALRDAAAVPSGPHADGGVRKGAGRGAGQARRVPGDTRRAGRHRSGAGLR